MKRAFPDICLTALILFIFFAGCSRFRKKDKNPPVFTVYIPLEDDYPILSRGIFATIENAFPKAKINLVEGLSDKYQIAPFDEWITKADSESMLKLQIRVERPEDRNQILTFLTKGESKIPFKVKIPKVDIEGSESKGEALFCRLKTVSEDLYEKQLCKELYYSLCGNETRYPSKKINALAAPSCSLVLVNPKMPLPDDPKLFFLTGFPLPIKVKNDYPLNRFGEVEESLLLNLF